jgi:hypothetical protein
MSARLDPPGELRIRRSGPADRTALAHLAQLDGAPPPAGDHLLAEEDGALRAALPLDGTPVLADPFHRTADIVAMLELRAAGLTPPAHGPRARGVPEPARRLLRRSLRPAPAKA